MSPFIITEGKKIVFNSENLENPSKFTIALLNFKREIDDLIHYSFNNDMLFQRARDAAF